MKTISYPRKRSERSRPPCCLALILSLLCGCVAASTAADYQILAQGVNAAATYDEAHFEVLGSQQRLTALYRQLFAGRLPPAEVPAVDFSQALVLFVALPQMPTSGHRIEVFRPQQKGDRLNLPLTFHHPPPGSAAAAVLTQPYVLVRVTRPAGLRTVRFVDAEGGLLARIELKPGT